MPPPEGKHDVSRARPAVYNNGSPRAPVSLLARGGISPPAPLLASRCLGSPSWQHHFAAESIYLCDTLSHSPSEKQMDVGMIVGKKRVPRASIAPQMDRAVFIPPTYPDPVFRQGCHQPLHRDRRGAASVRQHINLATPACTPIKTGALTAPVTKGRWPGLSPGWPDPRGRRTPA